MKKLWTERRWKERQRRRQRYELARVKAGNRRRRRHRPRRTSSGKPTRVAAPAVFSIIGNPEGATVFFREVLRASRIGHPVFIDLAAVTELTSDAITALLSLLSKVRTHLFGNQPSAPEPAAMLVEAGFYRFVRVSFRTSSGAHGAVYKHDSHQRVEPLVAKKLISFTTRSLFGSERYLKGVYRVLIEAMSNTHDHASATDIREKWWASAYYDEGTRRGHFTFVDVGVGIFKSVRIEKLRKVFRSVGLESNASILEDILEGRVASRTGLPYRGKGLPKITEVARRGEILDLVIVSNDVFANVSRNEFRSLATPFEGTLLRWEVAP